MTELCDGSERCIPRAQRNEAYFADDTCSTPLALVHWRAGCGEPEPTLAILGFDCLNEGSLVSLGGRAQLTAVYHLSGADCVPSLLDQGDDFGYYVVNEAVPLSTFAPVDRRVE